MKNCLAPALLAAVTLVVPARADDLLPVGVQAVLAHRGIPSAAVSIDVREVGSGREVLTWQADVARVPASIMKLLPSLVALETLGPAYTWTTRAYLLGELADGTLDGDLLLEGRGDPYLVTERVWQLQRELRAAGLRHIDGDLLLDGSWFDVGEYDPAAFDREPLRAYNVAPHALLMNYKVASFVFSPAAGGAVDVAIEPPLPNLAIDNRLRSTPGPCRGYQRGIAVHANATYDRITLSGRFPAGCERYRLDRSVLSHEAYAFGLFAALWRESGGELSGGWRTAAAPADAEPLLEFESLPLAEIVRKLNKHSNNVMTRQLLYTLGAASYGPPGTEEKGQLAIAAWLERNGLASATLELDNGAGLSREARIAARDMVGLLLHAWDSRLMPEFVSALPLSGIDGTLSRRLRGAGLDGSAHLKTGSLDHVSSIAGFLQSTSGKRYALTLIINHDNVHRGTGDEVQDALLRWLLER